MSRKESDSPSDDARFSKGAYEKTVNYAITLLEAHGDGKTCLKYLKGVREKFEKPEDTNGK